VGKLAFPLLFDNKNKMFVTIDEVKEYIWDEISVSDLKIEMIIRWITSNIQKESWNNILVKDYIEYLNWGNSKLFLKAYPVKSFTSFETENKGVFKDFGYYKVNKENGIIYTNWTPFWKQNIKVKYSAWYLETPFDIKAFVLKYVSYQISKKDAIKEITIEWDKVSYESEQALNEELKEIINKYRIYAY
jgi:hypothetical protein